MERDQADNAQVQAMTNMSESMNSAILFAVLIHVSGNNSADKFTMPC